ncbi:4Fe-4S binding protein [Geovibrio thiophilus]|uniref:4Fe-4S binding protein n=1 Tax=Geovibrio thiophilus TaxID=139438 RepID=A0A410JWZ1_9BACT|nr:4Fe-4S binding protein [Geovibrio thiophilus]QAR32674.1 4Fe-4S binding protein [Geovibrio thiophilus]
MSKIRLSEIRKYVLYGGTALILTGTAVSYGVGTYCSVCPVGFLQITAASGTVPVKMIPAVFIGVFAVYLLGRFFCSWLCTTTLLRTVSGTENKCRKCGTAESGYKGLMPYFVLAAALIFSFILGFPVFCLVCPVGLFFGVVYAFFRLFVVMEPSWNLIIFPAIIFSEIFILKKWCYFICPISAMFTLISKIPGIKFRPKVNQDTCQLSEGIPCSICRGVCPEGEEVLTDEKEMTEHCTNCMACKDACPTDSIVPGIYISGPMRKSVKK